MDALRASVVRRDELAGRVKLDEDLVHRAARRLAEDQEIHIDGRYWILGAKRVWR